MGADGGRGTKLDCAVDAALLLARVALANGDRCGAALFDNKVTGYLSPRASMASFPAVVEIVYDAQSRWQETDFRARSSRICNRDVRSGPSSSCFRTSATRKRATGPASRSPAWRRGTW